MTRKTYRRPFRYTLAEVTAKIEEIQKNEFVSPQVIRRLRTMQDMQKYLMTAPKGSNWTWETYLVL